MFPASPLVLIVIALVGLAFIALQVYYDHDRATAEDARRGTFERENRERHDASAGAIAETRRHLDAVSRHALRQRALSHARALEKTVAYYGRRVQAYDDAVTAEPTDNKAIKAAFEARQNAHVMAMSSFVGEKGPIQELIQEYYGVLGYNTRDMMEIAGLLNGLTDADHIQFVADHLRLLAKSVPI